MLGFLVLLPITMISIVIGLLVLTSPQLSDYVDFLTQLDIPDDKTQWHYFQSDWRYWALMASHFVAYFALCFAAIATVRTVSVPLSDEKPSWLRAVQVFLEVVFVTIPSSVLLWISGRALLDEPLNPLLWIMTGTLSIGLIVCVLLTVQRRSIELYDSTVTPFRFTKTDIGAVSVALLVGIVVVAFTFKPEDSADIIGMFPVVMLATATLLLLLAGLFSRYGSPVAALSLFITVVVSLNLLDQGLWTRREFTHSLVEWKATPSSRTDAEDIKAQRNIPTLKAAFREWLEIRRPAIDAYVASGKTFPILFASAQGGGIYAAFHPAITLARLTDACPELARHLFGMTSVSGGSLGAAVYTESVRLLPDSILYSPSSSKKGCTGRGDPGPDNTPVETYVTKFFNTDLLSPVVVSALIFDVPSMVVPQLRFGYDRARALENGVEVAWRKLGQGRPNVGMSAPFYGRWTPSKNAPALFMATTGVNFGVPVLLSQIDFSRSALVTRPRKVTNQEIADQKSAGESDALRRVREQFAQSGETVQVNIANVLDFRPDLQLTMSTAAILSARFPFVTPPGVVGANAKIKPAPLYQNTNYLELTDGGFYDNSGGASAREVILQMQRLLREPEFAEFKDRVSFHWIRFTHTPARRQVANEGGNYELIAPLVAFETVRQSRVAVQFYAPSGVEPIDLYLLDEWYEGTLNWLLSHGTKTKIRTRSSWLEGYQNAECCVVRNIKTNEVRRVPLERSQMEELRRNGFESQLVLPNATNLLKILSRINEGVSLKTDAAQGSSHAP